MFQLSVVGLIALSTTLLMGSASGAGTEKSGGEADNLGVREQAQSPLSRVSIRTSDPQALATRLERGGFDVLWGSITDDSLELIVTEADMEALIQRGLTPRLLERSRPFYEILDELDDVPPGYSDLADIVVRMQDAAAAYPDICQFVDVTTMMGTDPTWEGRHLYAVKISDNVTMDEDEPTSLVVSCHHAREIVTPELALYAIEQLTTQYGIDPQITAVVDDSEIWIAPMWNPDGYNYVFTTNNMWRKNRRQFGSYYGVDLNRNYPQGWYNGCSGSTSPSSITYKGPEPASEVETQTMMALSLDRRFARVLDLHNYGRESLYGYACWSHPFDAYLQQEAIDLSTASGYGGDHRRPSADGEHQQWQFAEVGSYAFLLETALAFQPSYAEALSEAALVWPGILWFLEHHIPLWGYVTDATTGNPVPATITYDGVVFPNGEVNTAGGPLGRYHAFLPAGTYDVVFEADGYERTVVSGVTITSSVSTRLDVTMANPPEVTSPNGGEVLSVGVPTDITWQGDPAASYHVQATYNYGDINFITDDFETGAFDSAYSTGGDLPWFVTSGTSHGGTYSAQGGNISHSQSTWLKRTVASGEVSFWYRVSSESGWDFFDFYVNGVNELHVSGEVPWTLYSATFHNSNNELKWEYAKDSNTSHGQDTAWIDDLQIMDDLTLWTDVIAMTDPGAMSTPWTPTQTSESVKIRVRAFYDGSYYGIWDESDDVFTVSEDGACPADLTGDDQVNIDDIFAVLGLWGNCPDPCPPYCTGDLTEDCAVNIDDIFAILGQWGPCD